MSRRKKQQIRRHQRATGASYNAARRALETGVPLARAVDDGWPPQSRDLVMATAIDTVRGYVGNSLPEHGASWLYPALGIPADAAPVDVMVTAVRAAPAPFPYMESSLVDEYEYGLRLDEVSLGFEADIELLGLPSSLAQSLQRAGEGTVTEDDGRWATLAVRSVGFVFTGQIRNEADSAEVVETWISELD